MALPSYVKTLWKNLAAPAINETHLNKIEKGIFDVTEQVIQNTGSLPPVGVAALVSDGSVRLDSAFVPTDDNDLVSVKAVGEIIRTFDTTIDMDTAGNSPSKAEAIAAFKLLPNFDWAKDDKFYIESTNKDKLNLVKYLSNGDTDESGTHYAFWVKELKICS